MGGFRNLFATFHPFPFGTWILVMAFSALVPISFVLVSRYMGSGCLVAVGMLCILWILLWVAMTELEIGFNYRQGPSSSEAIRSLPWAYNPYWKYLLQSSTSIFAASALLSLVVWAVKKWKTPANGQR